MPFSDSPVFWLETRHRRFVRNFSRQSRFLVLVAVGFIVILWAIPLLNATPAGSSAGYYYASSYAFTSSTTMGWLMVASIGFNFLLDMVCLAMSLNSISGDINRGHWDLLRLTPLRETEIISAKHAFVQIRSWRMTMWVIGLRIGIVVLVLLHLSIIPYLDEYENNFFEDLSRSFMEYPVEVSSSLFILSIFTIIYLVEPLWRMRALTALGMAISARIHNLVFSTLAGLGSLIAVWISQAMIMGGIIWGLFAILPGVNEAITGLCCLLMACIFTGFVIHLYYSRLSDWALTQATQNAFRS